MMAGEQLIEIRIGDVARFERHDSTQTSDFKTFLPRFEGTPELSGDGHLHGDVAFPKCSDGVKGKVKALVVAHVPEDEESPRWSWRQWLRSEDHVRGMRGNGYLHPGSDGSQFRGKRAGVNDRLIASSQHRSGQSNVRNVAFVWHDVVHHDRHVWPTASSTEG
jgi:hypothetical protein